MPAPELVRFATYCRSMATAVMRTVAMATQDVNAARAAEREHDTTYPLTSTQALAIKAELLREHALWLQLAGEIDAHLDRDPTPTDDEPHLFTDHGDPGWPTDQPTPLDDEISETRP